MNTENKVAAEKGSKVTFLHPNRSGPQKCALETRVENDPSVLCISCTTPVGKALLGKRPGDRARVILPNGDEVTLEIIDVEPAAETVAA